jgi:hypothetical protein
VRAPLCTVVATALAACSTDAAPPAANDDSVAIFLGGSTTVDVLANDVAGKSALELSSVEIVSAPLAGVVKIDGASGTIGYRHNGISAGADTFSYRVKDASGTLSNTAAVTVLVNVSDARVEILQPPAGSAVTGDALTVKYAVSGSGFNHLHLALDGIGHNTITDLTGTYVFTSVTPGAHVLSAELVDADHRPINAPASKDSVSVNVVR